MPTPDTSRATFDSLFHARDIACARWIDLSDDITESYSAEIAGLMDIAHQQAIWQDIDRGTYLTPAQVGLRMAVAEAHAEALLWNDAIDAYPVVYGAEGWASTDHNVRPDHVCTHVEISTHYVVDGHDSDGPAYCLWCGDDLLSMADIDAAHSEALAMNTVHPDFLPTTTGNIVHYGRTERAVQGANGAVWIIVTDGQGDESLTRVFVGTFTPNVRPVSLSKPTDRNPSYCPGDGVPVNTGTYFTGDYRWMVRNLRDNVHSALAMLVRP